MLWERLVYLLGLLPALGVFWLYLYATQPGSHTVTKYEMTEVN